jgi:hypothetical protein
MRCPQIPSRSGCVLGINSALWNPTPTWTSWWLGSLDVVALAGVVSPTVRWPEPLGGFRPDLADREIAEWPAIVDLLAGRSPHRILMLRADSGYGKSELLYQATAYARQLGIAIAHLDFKGPFSDVRSVLGHIGVELGEHLPEFCRHGADKPHLLCKDLRAVRRPLLVILDSYEKATAVVTDWVDQCLLPEVSRSLCLAVIVAGHRCPEVDDARWRGLARRLSLGPIHQVEAWEKWLLHRYPNFRELKVDVPTLVMVSGGVPKTFSNFCRTIAEQDAG